jgi:hypothetical protein
MQLHHKAFVLAAHALLISSGQAAPTFTWQAEISDATMGEPVAVLSMVVICFTSHYGHACSSYTGRAGHI